MSRIRPRRAGRTKAPDTVKPVTPDILKKAYDTGGISAIASDKKVSVVSIS